MQTPQTFTFPSSSVASGSNNDWPARPTQAVSSDAIPDFWPIGPDAFHTDATTDYGFPGLKSNGTEPVRGLVPRADGKMTVLNDLAFLSHPHTPPAPTAASSIPASESAVKLCSRCMTGYTAEEDGPEVCPIFHTPPIDAWIRGNKANYPVHYYRCCGTYRLAIPGLQLQRPFDPVCRLGAHIPAD